MSRFLWSQGLTHVDYALATHADADHIGGLVDVLEAFEVGVVYVSGDPKGTLTYNTFLRGVRYEGSKVEVVRAGRRMDWGGVQADTLVSKHPALKAAISRLVNRGGVPRLGDNYGALGRPVAGSGYEIGAAETRDALLLRRSLRFLYHRPVGEVEDAGAEGPGVD